MIALLLLVIFGLGMAFFSTQNTGLVHITLGQYTLTGIPLYVIVVGALLLGIFASWLISLVDAFYSSHKIHGKDSELHNAQKTITQLQKENHDLELENVRLKNQSHEEVVEQHSQPEPQKNLRPSLFNFT